MGRTAVGFRAIRTVFIFTTICILLFFDNALCFYLPGVAPEDFEKWHIQLSVTDLLAKMYNLNLVGESEDEIVRTGSVNGKFAAQLFFILLIGSGFLLFGWNSVSSGWEGNLGSLLCNLLGLMECTQLNRYWSNRNLT